MSVNGKHPPLVASLPARVQPAIAIRPGRGTPVDTAARHFRPWASGFKLPHHRAGTVPANLHPSLRPAPQSATRTRVVVPAQSARTLPTASVTQSTTSVALDANRAVAAARRAMNVNNSVGSTTGILPWWTYYGSAVPGAGAFDVNVATGNLVFLASDVSVPHKGISLSFARSYNSQSTHDNLGTDGSIPSNYGNGWTCTYDIRVANNTSGGISVFTVDGARLDYTPDGSGGYIPPSGIHAELQLLETAVQWTQTDGTVYVFNLPTQPQATAGLAGRLASIYGRNTNNSLTLTYSFDNGDASTAENLNQVVVTAEDGMALTLSFANFNSIRLLSSLTWPDGHQVTYAYDNYANLISVTRPGNNIATTLEESHNYVSPASSYQMQTIVDPRQNISSSDGGWATLSYNASGLVSGVNYSGYVNPTIADGTNSGPIQPSEPTGLTVWRSVTVNYPSSGNSNVGDTDGHYEQYVFDSTGRITSTESYTSPTTYLLTQHVWDGDNQLISAIDARGYETDYANDGYGDITAIGYPSTTTTEGMFRPTTYTSYDANHNVIASCDQHWSNQNAMDWTSRPSNSMTLCPSASGATRNVFTPTSAEPFGELTSTTTPLGYTTTIAYNPSSQGGTDYGLPTSRTGASITQNDQSLWTPTQTFTYDAYGDVLTQNDGVGTWTTAYDGMNRPLSTIDADNVASYTAYYPDGQVQLTQNAAQYQYGGGMGTIFAYDADGNQTSMTHHYGNVAGVTSYYYDGPGRLVETVYPHDATDFFSFSTMIRNLYDLTQGGTVSIGSNSGLKAYGEMYGTQEWSPTGTQSGTPSGTPTWNATNGQTFDPLDRTTSVYALAYLTSGPQYRATYDASSATLGLLSTQTDAYGQVSTFGYDARGMRNAVTYSNLQTAGSTPNESYEADADGRLASAAYASLVTSTWTYDADGRLVTSSNTGASPYGTATNTYGYYANGARATLSVQDSAASRTGINYTNLLTYDYFSNGKLKTLTPGSQLGFSGPGGSSFSWTYTNAGRMSSQSDPYTGTAFTVVLNINGQIVDEQLKLVSASRGYNGYGQVGSLKLPMNGQYTNMSYDVEDEIENATGFSVPTAWGGTGQSTSVAYTYNVRGEVVSQNYTAQGSSSFSTAWPYQALAAGSGAMSSMNVQGGATAPVTSFSPLSGEISQITNSNATYRTYSYDSMGRQVSGSTQPVSPAETLARTYDARNRLVSDVRNDYPQPGSTNCAGNLSSAAGSPITKTYVWGPSGRSVAITSSSGTYRDELLRWDGNNLLYTVNGSTKQGGIDDFKITDLDGNILGEANLVKGIQIVWDRDMSGNVVSSHNSVGFGGWTSPNSYNQQCAGPGTTESSSAYAEYATANIVAEQTFGPVLTLGSDGITDQYNAFEGARAMDPITGQWLSPDLRSPFYGTSQVQGSTTWHRNNSLAFVDPTGMSSQRNPLGLSTSQPTSDIAYRSLLSASPGTTSTIVTEPSQLPEGAPGSPDDRRGVMAQPDECPAHNAPSGCTIYVCCSSGPYGGGDAFGLTGDVPGAHTAAGALTALAVCRAALKGRTPNIGLAAFCMAVGAIFGSGTGSLSRPQPRAGPKPVPVIRAEPTPNYKGLTW